MSSPTVSLPSTVQCRSVRNLVAAFEHRNRANHPSQTHATTIQKARSSRPSGLSTVYPTLSVASLVVTSQPSPDHFCSNATSNGSSRSPITSLSRSPPTTNRVIVSPISPTPRARLRRLITPLARQTPQTVRTTPERQPKSVKALSLFPRTGESSTGSARRAVSRPSSMDGTNGRLVSRCARTESENRVRNWRVSTASAATLQPSPSPSSKPSSPTASSRYSSTCYSSSPLTTSKSPGVLQSRSQGPISPRLIKPSHFSSSPRSLLAPLTPLSDKPRYMERTVASKLRIVDQGGDRVRAPCISRPVWKP
ncbi:hypothetical protein JAAARDRAFT_35818 [Jaapia argillacea MUCL 33604]|uniref:Uncharacterized protein n=1 Tax=Jaapia argillacea MUCL 33604 TaxID=933084 RepID=A0A067Q3P6_9AGAM|nr:hypothetical protein JAAARDRAFT_35818 [Jaapia argillacea MUCL 33604]